MLILKLFAWALAGSGIFQHFAAADALDNPLYQLESDGSARETLLISRLSTILCNLDVKSIYVCFDSDKMATSMVNRVIANVAQCSSVAITLLRYHTLHIQTNTHTHTEHNRMETIFRI